MSTQKRRLRVLEAIVVEHVATSEPVSSKTVAQEYVPQVSSATIRSDMCALEEQGLIRQPHTSAGRVPTEAGYRLFVDHLDYPKPVSQGELRRLESGFDEAEDYNQIIERTARLLAQLTKQAAVVELPDLSIFDIRRVELIDLSCGRMMVLVVSKAGRILERQIELPQSCNFEETLLRQASRILTETYDDAEEMERDPHLVTSNNGVSWPLKQLLSLAVTAVTDMVRPTETNRFATAGASYLARRDAGFDDVSVVLKALEEQDPIVEVLRDLHTEPVQVSIGAENENKQLSEASVVSATYSISARRPVHVGIVGPTRMDYRNSLGAVKAVSEYLSKLLLVDLGIEKEKEKEEVE